jgi:hypothetical protein
VARTNVNGICALCLRKSRLCRSHYIAKAFYKLCREAGLNPIVLTPKIVKHSPRQMRAHLLCRSCEEKLKTNGEDPVLALVDRAGSFPLLERMNDTAPVGTSGPVPFYAAKSLGVDPSALAYFAISLLWRGSLLDWGTLRSQTTSISLGAYRDTFRSFLAGETGFPRHTYIIVTACTDTGSREMILSPWLVSETSKEHQQLETLVRGIWFRVVVGNRAPLGLASLCCMQSNEKRLFKRNEEQEVVHACNHFYRSAEIAENVKNRPGPSSSTGP